MHYLGKNSKKMLSVGLATMLFASIAVPSASAYSSKIEYDGHLAEQRLDIDNDGVEDITINDTITFGIKVPASVIVDGASAEASIAGITDTSVTLTADKEVVMSQDEVSANKLTAKVKMGELTEEEENTLTLGTAIKEIARVQADVNSTWDNNTPRVGNWSGAFNYNVAVTEQDIIIVSEDALTYGKLYKPVGNKASYQTGDVLDYIVPMNDGIAENGMTLSKYVKLYTTVEDVKQYSNEAILNQELAEYFYTQGYIEAPTYDEMCKTLSVNKDTSIEDKTIMASNGVVHLINSMDEYNTAWNSQENQFVYILDSTLDTSIVADYTQN